MKKSYADLKRREEEFAISDKVCLKVSPTKGVMTFGKKGKLNAKYVGTYGIIERFRNVADKCVSNVLYGLLLAHFDLISPLSSLFILPFPFYIHLIIHDHSDILLDF